MAKNRKAQIAVNRLSQMLEPRVSSSMNGLLDSVHLDFIRLGGGENALINGESYLDLLTRKGYDFTLTDEHANSPNNYEILKQLIKNDILKNNECSNEQLQSFLENFSQGHWFTVYAGLKEEIRNNNEDNLRPEAGNYYLDIKSEKNNLEFNAITKIKNGHFRDTNDDTPKSEEGYVLNKDNTLKTWDCTIVEQAKLSIDSNNNVQYGPRNISTKFLTPPKGISKYETGFDDTVLPTVVMVDKIDKVVEHLRGTEKIVGNNVISGLSLINALKNTSNFHRSFNQLVAIAHESRNLGMWHLKAVDGENRSSVALKQIEKAYSSFFSKTKDINESNTKDFKGRMAAALNETKVGTAKSLPDPRSADEEATQMKGP